MNSASGVVCAYLENEQSIALVSRNEAGRRIIKHVPTEYVAFYRTAHLSEQQVRDLKGSSYVRGVREEGSWLRVAFKDSTSRADYCSHRASPLVQLGIASFEADIDPVLRYFLDHPEVTIASPRRVYLDIETDSRKTFVQAKKGESRILSWVLVDDDTRVQIGVLETDTDRDERTLLDALWSALEPYDQVAAWGGDGFDFPIIHARSEQRGCAVNTNHWLWVDHLATFERMNKNASESAEEKQSMRLQDIAQAVLGKGKEETPPEVAAKFGDKPLGALTWPLWEAGDEWRALMVRYMLQDGLLLQEIEKETGYLALLQVLCGVCRIFADSAGNNPTHQMDGFMLTLGAQRDFHFPTKQYREGIEKFKGAYVMEPECSGITRDVHVCDFASLYPSIILTWNMSPETKVSGVPAGHPVGPSWDLCVCPGTGIYFSTSKEGILPFALREAIRLRKHWNDLKSTFPPGTPEWHDANRKSAAYKVFGLSFYGIMGSPFSRFFDRQIAESVTQNGVWLIHETIELVRQNEMNAVYGDTDSVFVTGCTREEFAHFVDHCNKELYPGLLEEVGCVGNDIKLAYEKAFDVLVMVSAKRYIGRYLHFKGKDATADSKPEIKGLEYKRGDASLLGRRLQARVIDLLCGGLNLNEGITVPTQAVEIFHKVVTEARAHVLNGTLTLPEVKISKSVSKPLKEYVQKIKMDGTLGAQPPHVVLAKIMKERGEDVSEGTRVDYVVVDDEQDDPKKRFALASDFDGSCDRFYLWENLVYPPAQRLLEAAFPDQDWKGWLKARPPKERKPRGKKASTETIAKSVEVPSQLAFKETSDDDIE